MIQCFDKETKFTLKMTFMYAQAHLDEQIMEYQHRINALPDLPDLKDTKKALTRNMEATKKQRCKLIDLESALGQIPIC